jgi:hypothetical protein
MGIKERRVLGSEQNIALAKHVERSAAGHTIDCCNDRFPQVIRLRAEQLAWVIKVKGGGSKPGDPVIVVVSYGPGTTLAVIDLFSAVNARTECPIASGSQHDAANLVLMAHASPELMELMHHLGIERVQDLGAVERHGGNALFAEFYGDGLMF